MASGFKTMEKEINKKEELDQIEAEERLADELEQENEQSICEL